jgi:hypothetical protein
LDIDRSRKAVRAYDSSEKWQFTPSLIKKARKHVEYLQTTLFRAFKENWKLNLKEVLMDNMALLSFQIELNVGMGLNT